MKKVYGYIRVSTIKQSEHGVSLQEQRDAIERYAGKNSLTVIEWFEEKETAAKRGRPVFNQMLKALRADKAHGVIMHKIDRSARNLKDWADLGELIDQGVDVHFANESLDLHARGGRLSADIQAVIAADYIRNLREETRKGFYGRLKQGIYPLPAPLGYRDMGAGKPKELDPAKAPLVRKAFELYRSGGYSLEYLKDVMHELGLRNRHGGKVSLNGISTILNNSFYIGIIKIESTGETFVGAHEPLIPKALFERVQAILRGKTNAVAIKHSFVFRRLLSCKGCGYSLIGEMQKGHVYYRCHTKRCPTTGVREEFIEEKIQESFTGLQLKEEDYRDLSFLVSESRGNWKDEREKLLKTLQLSLKQIEGRLGKLTDAYLDGVLDKETFLARKESLLMEQKAAKENLADLEEKNHSVPEKVSEFLERSKIVYSSYISGFPEEKREMLEIVTSNRIVEGKNLYVELKSPFRELANYAKYSNGGPYRGRPRTFEETGVEKLFKNLREYFS